MIIRRRFQRITTRLYHYFFFFTPRLTEKYVTFSSVDTVMIVSDVYIFVDMETRHAKV